MQIDGQEINIFEESPQNIAAALEPEKIETPIQTAEAVETDDDIEARAISYGWKPDYDGPHKKSAKEFLELGEQRAPLLKQRLKQKEDEIATLRKSYNNLMQTSAETIRKKTEENEARIADLEKGKVEARENLDVDKLEKIVNEQNNLKAETQALKNTPPPIDPSVQAWAIENQDFVKKVQSDPVLEEYSNVWAAKNIGYLQTLPPAERFAKVQEHILQEFAHKFTNANQQQAPKTQPTHRTPSMQKPVEAKLSISTLPPAEKAAFDLIVKASRFKTEADKKAFETKYLEEYKTIYGG